MMATATGQLEGRGGPSATTTLHNAHYRRTREQAGEGRLGPLCPVSRKMSNLTHLVGSHVGQRPVRQERETSLQAARVHRPRRRAARQSGSLTGPQGYLPAWRASPYPPLVREDARAPLPGLPPAPG